MPALKLADTARIWHVHPTPLTLRFSGENTRTTRHFSYESVPEWNQTMVYPKVAPDALRASTLEVSIWNHDPYKGDEHIGQVCIDLSGALAHCNCVNLTGV